MITCIFFFGGYRATIHDVAKWQGTPRTRHPTTCTSLRTRGQQRHRIPTSQRIPTTRMPSVVSAVPERSTRRSPTSDRVERTGSSLSAIRAAVQFPRQWTMPSSTKIRLPWLRLTSRLRSRRRPARPPQHTGLGCRAQASWQDLCVEKSRRSEGNSRRPTENL